MTHTGKSGKAALPINSIILPDLHQDRKAIEVSRQWINTRFELLDEHGKPLPTMRIPFKFVHVPISQSILEATGISCAQVRGTTSEEKFEAEFLASGAWSAQSAGVVTVAVTDNVVEMYKHFFTGKNVDDEKASLGFRTELGKQVHANPENFKYDVTDGAHRTELGTANFGPEVIILSQNVLPIGHPLFRLVDGTKFSPQKCRWKSVLRSPSAPISCHSTIPLHIAWYCIN